MSHNRPWKAQIQEKQKPGQENPRFTARRSPAEFLKTSNVRGIFQSTPLNLIGARATTVFHSPSLFQPTALAWVPLQAPRELVQTVLPIQPISADPHFPPARQ